MKNKILVIGSKGQVASCLKEITDNNWYFAGRPDLNICDENSLGKFIAKLKPSLIINTAAYTDVEMAETEIDAAYMLNSTAVKNLSLECKINNIPLIHISTDYVFNGKKSSPYTEEDIANPLSVYGKSKFEGEGNIRHYLKDYIIIRTSWVFSHYGSNFVKTMIKLGALNKTLQIIDDQFGCPTSAINLSKVIKQITYKILASEGGVIYGTYNYCDKPALSWYNFAEKIFEILVTKYNYTSPHISRISSDQYDSRVTRPQNSILDCTLINNNFDIKQYDWALQLENCIKELL